jgi:cytoskeletal protein CcmA (bactofilin family)
VGDTVPADQVIDNDVLASGTDVVIDGTINGDLLAVGTTVTVNGSVSGSLVAVGRMITLNGEVGGSVYAVSRVLVLGPSAAVENNLHYAGLSLDGQLGSRIGRDLVAASVRGHISSEIGRALNALILLLTFNGRIGGGVDAQSLGAPTLPVDSAGTPSPSSAGVLFIGSSAGKPFGLAAPARLVSWATEEAGGLRSLPLQEEEAAGLVAGIPEWLVARLGDLVVLLLVGGLALWLTPFLFPRSAEALRRKPIPVVGLGVLALIIAMNGVAVAILFGALLLVSGLWLGGVTLWGLALLLWGIGFPALILALSLFALVVLYGSKTIIADMVGTAILGRLAPRALEYRILPLLLGLVLYVVLRSIPLLGWVIEVVVTILGLGAIWVALRDRRKGSPSPSPAWLPDAPAPASLEGEESVAPAQT